MSVVMKDLETKKLILFCKGADSMILKRLRSDSALEILDKVKEDLKNFSRQGLRTLAIGYKPLDENEFYKWNKKYVEAQQEEFNVLADIDPQIKLREVSYHLPPISTYPLIARRGTRR